MATLPAALHSAEIVRGRVKLFFVDGGSTDGTLEYLQAYIGRTRKALLLAQEGTGLYEALNQGIQAAINDPDVTHVGLLHSDDRLIAGSFERYLSVIEAGPAPVFFSDIEYHDSSGKLARVWQSGHFSRLKLNTGWMPPHTSMIVSKEVYLRFGSYDPSFGTASDYEWIVRVLSELGEQSQYFPEKTLSMLVGGASSSSLTARLRANAMDGKVWAESSVLQAFIVRICKPLRKIVQFKLV